MLLGDLIQSVTFEQIVPHILREYPEHKSQIPYYKEAFDILRHMEYAENSATIPVEWVREEDEEPYIHIGNCEGDYWESNLGKRLEIAGDVHLSDAELAARCMWSLTFYGYSPDDDNSYFDREPHNFYEEQAERLNNRNILNYARLNRSEYRKQFGEKKRPMFTIETWETIERRERRRNRAKRMRDYRQERRIKRLEYCGKVEQDIRRILARTQEIARTDLSYLFDTQLVAPATYRSRAFDRSQRLPYLREIVTRYADWDEDDLAKFTRLVVVLSADPAAPFDTDERDTASEILACLAQRSPNAEVLWSFGTAADLGEEAELLFLRSY